MKPSMASLSYYFHDFLTAGCRPGTVAGDQNVKSVVPVRWKTTGTRKSVVPVRWKTTNLVVERLKKNLRNLKNSLKCRSGTGIRDHSF